MIEVGIKWNETGNGWTVIYQHFRLDEENDSLIPLCEMTILTSATWKVYGAEVDPVGSRVEGIIYIFDLMADASRAAYALEKIYNESKKYD
jgi:hypothetical protein